MAKSTIRDPSTGKFTTNGRSELDRLFTNRHFKEAVENVLTTRQTFFNQFLDPRRDLNDECGYPATGQISVSDYQSMYDRNPVAARVVELLPSESFQLAPTIYENNDSDVETAFEEDWKEVARKLGEDDWYQSEDVNPIWPYILDADIKSGIGTFGLLLLGIDDGRDLSEPVDGIDPDGMSKPFKPGPKQRELLYLRVFSQSAVEVSLWETNEASPRFGKPKEYRVTFNDPREMKYSGAGSTPPTKALSVHWSRVIHCEDNWGVPRQQPVWNRLYDLDKLYGGSAEMYWRGAFPGLAIETHPQLGGDVTIDKDAFRSEMEKYMNGLQRYLALMGMSAKSLAPQVVDPSPQIDKQIEAICIRLSVAKRIFMGSERGELASGQDDKTWNDKLHHRNQFYTTPKLISPVVGRLIRMRVLTTPEQYYCDWPDLNTVSDDERATVAVKRTDAMSRYIGGNVESLMAPIDFLTREMGYSQDEAMEITEAAVELIEERQEEEMEQQRLLLEQQPPVGGLEGEESLEELEPEEEEQEDEE